VPALLRENPACIQGMVTTGRGCTDIVCLLIFGFFWAGMGWIGYKALHEGDPQKIVSGLDSYGNYCGMVNTRENGTAIVDLRKATKLYYLNPLELLDPSNYPYARTVCVEECPTAARTCSSEDFPCTSPEQYVCPYYGYSQFAASRGDKLGIFSSGGFENTKWWGSLLSLNESACVDADVLITIPSSISDDMNATKGCGQYYQMTSMYPGVGPCSSVLFETVEFMHRCYPVIPKDVYGNISMVAAGGLAQGISAVPTDQISQVHAQLLHVAPVLDVLRQRQCNNTTPFSCTQ
jgi:solute carrier family 44 (choline transporter-like protein), member 2/4/5